MISKRQFLHIPGLILIFLIVATPLVASNRVRVATIGGRPSFNYDQSRGMQFSVDQLIGFWKKEINQVLPDKPDLILLPELCDVPFGLKPSDWKNYIQVRGTQILDELRGIAVANHCYIAYGTLRLDGKRILRNSAVLINRQGEIAGTYNKHFPTIDEIDSGIMPGDELPVFQCDFGKLAMVICFDLNFPELLNDLETKRPDIILFPSNYHGAAMQNIWAYWCRSFFVGSINGSGTASEIRNRLGEVVASSTNYFDYAVATINLDSRVVHLGYNFGKLAELKKKYGRMVTISDPGELGPVLVSVESDQFNVDKILNEFEIEQIDPYFNRSRAKRKAALEKR